LTLLLSCIYIGKIERDNARDRDKQQFLGDTTEDRIVSIFCRVAQGSQGKYSQLSLSPTVTLMYAANVNDPLQLRQRKEF
jgi:hypothetical protein